MNIRENMGSLTFFRARTVKSERRWNAMTSKRSEPGSRETLAAFLRSGGLYRQLKHFTKNRQRQITEYSDHPHSNQFPKQQKKPYLSDRIN